MRTDGAPAKTDRRSPLPAWEPPPSVAARTPETRREAVRLSLRILVELHRWRVPPDGGTASWQSTQQGLAQELAASQGAVSKVLARLVAANIVRAERRHVHGLERRVRVYSLTPQGEGLALEIRQRFGLGPPSAPIG